MNCRLAPSALLLLAAPLGLSACRTRDADSKQIRDTGTKSSVDDTGTAAATGSDTADSEHTGPIDTGPVTSPYDYPMDTLVAIQAASDHAFPCVPCLVTVDQNTGDQSAAFGCPLSATRGETTLYTGGCMVPGECAFEGLLARTYHREPEGTSDYTLEFTDFEMSLPHLEIEFAGDGILNIANSATDYAFTVDITYASDDGPGDSWSDGSWRYVISAHSEAAATVEFAAGEVEFLSGTWLGTFRMDYATTDVASCPEEPAGSMTLEGTVIATITYDGDTRCDGCASVTVAGVEIGQICG